MNDISKSNRRQFIIASAAMAGGMLLPRPTLAGTPAAMNGEALQPAKSAGPISLHGVSPRLTLHILDTYHGAAATGLHVEFSRMENDVPVLVQKVVVNQNGRTAEPLLIGDAYREGDYQLLLHVDEFYRMRGTQLPSPSFLSKVPIRFRIVSAAERLHLPVQFGPWNYTYYRGS